MIYDRSFYDNTYIANNHSSPDHIDIRREGRISVLAVVEKIGKYPTPCAYIRILLPLTHSNINKHVDLLVVNPDEVIKYVADILISHRVAIKDLQLLDSIIRHCKDNGMKFIYDIDDNLLNMGDHTEADYYNALKPVVSRSITGSDQVWVSTNLLYEEIKGLNDRISVIPNALSEEIWDRPEQKDSGFTGKDRIGIVYMGTATHSDDLRLVSGAVRRILNEYRHKVAMYIIGITDDSTLTKGFKEIRVPYPAHETYPSFVNWLKSQDYFDIGLAPLDDTAFNRSKSPIKFFDYAALGLCVVCSNLEPYRDVIQHGVNGLTVNNTEQDWYDALKLLIEDGSLRKRMGYQAYHDFQKKYSLDQLGSNWLNSLYLINGQNRRNPADMSDD